MTGRVWTTTVTELVLVFRDALAALAPVLARAHIRAAELDAYDDWDEIAESLYRNIVERSIRWGVPGAREVALPRYATMYDDYSARPYIGVGAANATRSAALHSFLYSAGRFDRVSAYDIDDAGRRGELRVNDVTEASSYLQLTAQDRIRDLHVEL